MPPPQRGVTANPVCGGGDVRTREGGSKMMIRGREYSDYDECLDEKQQYRLDAMREGRWERERLEATPKEEVEEEEGGE